MPALRGAERQSSPEQARPASECGLWVASPSALKRRGRRARDGVKSHRQDRDDLSLLDRFAFFDQDLGDSAGRGGADRDLHLHGFDHYDRILLPDAVADGDHDAEDVSGNLGPVLDLSYPGLLTVINCRSRLTPRPRSP